MSDLLTRWKNITCGPLGYCSEPLAELIAETIAALSPVTDEEVEKECRHLRLEHEGRAAELIERQTQEIAALKLNVKYYKDVASQEGIETDRLTDKLAKAGEALTRIGFGPQASPRHAEKIALRALTDLQESNDAD